MPRSKPIVQPRTSLRERQIPGADAGWRALQFITASEGFLAERVDKALELLAGAGGLSVAEIANATGFSSHAYFCQVIRKYTGRSPGENRGEYKSERQQDGAADTA